MKSQLHEHHTKNAMIVSRSIKWTLMAAAIVLGIGGALLTRPNADVAKTNQHFSAAEGCMWSKADQLATQTLDH